LSAGADGLGEMGDEGARGDRAQEATRELAFGLGGEPFAATWLGLWPGPVTWLAEGEPGCEQDKSLPLVAQGEPKR
jgi:hypothetical protein